jgi:hypothetical protein
MGVTPDAEHEVQLVLVPRHVWHVELQLRQTLVSSTTLRYEPIAQTVVQVPAPALKLAPGRHDVQLVADESVHVAQDASHAWHVLFASAYLPAGQLLTHDPSS